MSNKQKMIIIMIVTATITCLIIGSTFAYWTWSTSSAQATSVTFTVASGFTCSADGGGNLTSSDVTLAPAECTNSTYAIKRTVKVSTTQDSGKTIYLDMKLKVDSISANLAASENFKYALTTSSTSCESGIMAEGTFNGTSANDELPLLTKEQYLSSTSNDTFYLWVWLDKKETNSDTQNQAFKLSLTGSCADQEPAKTYAPWGAEVDMYKRIDFSQVSSSSNGQGLYVFKPTANDTNPVYYYRGAVTNNNVIFGGFCWKIVRSTETAGTKLIYNGTPSNGECTVTTGVDTQIGTSEFNNGYGLDGIGYMYGIRYSRVDMSSFIDFSYKYGNSVSWNGSRYTLINTIDSTGDWSSDYNTLNSNHYSCFNTTGTCSSLYYVYYTKSSNGYYIRLTGGKTVEDALDEMLSNTTNSSIKTTIDNWYDANLTGYTSYLEDTVWCNDRSISELNGWNPNGGDMTKNIYFSPYTRTYTTYSPTVICPSTNDSFTVSSNTGNGKLDYPVGLITSDEVILAGGKYGTNNGNYYLRTNKDFWTMSPVYYQSIAYMWLVSSLGSLPNNYQNAQYALGVRPMISLKSGGTWSGSGTSSDPYTVNYS